MKKIAYIFMITVFLGSCDDLVEEEVFSTITPNNFFQNERDVATAVNGVYDGIQNLNIWYRLFYTTELTGGIMKHNWNPMQQTMVYENDAGDVWNLWWRNYGAIGRANAVLSVMEASDLEESLKNRYAAEVRFIRGYVYFNLVRLFGRIPLVTNPPSSLSDVVVPDSTNTEAFESEFMKQVDRNEIYAFIIDDLEFAEASLPDAHGDNDAGRATSGAASGLLARVYLTMAGMQYDYNSGELKQGDPAMYARAVTKTDELMSAGYSLMENYADIYENDNNKEILFSIQYLESAVAGVTGEGNQIVARTGIRGAKDFTPYSWLQCSVNEVFWQDFIANNSKDDHRYWRTFLEYYVKADGDTVWHGSSNTFRRPHVRKFLTDVGPDTQAQGSTDYGADWIIMRYADVLLMNSEALNESGDTPDANTINGINQVRERAGKDPITLPISKEDLREAIWKERKWELCFEGLHYFDCQRTGRLLDEFALYPNSGRRAEATQRHYIYPIPFDAMQANPSLKQNAGW
ncbi:MAG: RagB/SusD family nutrient uptake outer membrane protein [Cytophagales bacterium]|nr:RagB/SusD family nutrient uptake outer membrane protein [Cytophagales bacterium]